MVKVKRSKSEERAKDIEMLQYFYDEVSIMINTLVPMETRWMGKKDVFDEDFSFIIGQLHTIRITIDNLMARDKEEEKK